MAVAAAGRPVSAYVGETYRIPSIRGGWNANPNVDQIPPESMVDALNINLHRGARETRGGVVKVHATAISSGARVMGITQFRKRNGTSFIVTATADGKIWKDYATLLKSGLTINRVTHFTTFNDTLYICNGADRPQTWDGSASATSNLTNIPSDWTGSAWPKQMIVHARGVARSLWAYGVSGKTQKVYAAPTGGDDFSDANLTTLVIETGDDSGVVALVEFGNRLIPIGKTRAYLIDDSDASRANWGYEAAQWDGGVASERLVVRTPNDVLVMSEDGDISSIIATQTTGDYATVSLARPAHIHVWIKDNVDLSLLATGAHAVYDPVLRACKVFVVRQDQSVVDTALVYFIDRPAEEAWARHQYYYTTAGIASASAVVRAAAGDSRVYVGGHDGFVRRLEDEDSALDDGSAYRNGYRTPELSFDDPRGLKRHDRGWLVMKQLGDESVTVNLYVDGASVADALQLVTSTGAELVTDDADTFEASSQTDFTVTPSGPGLTTVSYPIGIVGTRIQAEVYGAVDGERFFVSQTMFDHTPLGAAAA
jgi:hypothetical protein